ncbi:MAG: DUF1428 domain-containing protein [Candidatus Saccharibacteria bacterium]|nr:DUF1428 domain-containing protein [Pseudorhodobacter sp.]
MAYVDAFVLPVYRDREDDYREMAELGCKVWIEHGALTYVECRADDVPDGKVTSFPMAVKLEPNEVVYVSYITYRDRAHRDEVNAKVMADPRMQGMKDTPFDLKRMIFGGFTPIVSSD